MDNRLVATDHVLERVFVAVRWYGSPADHPEPHGPTVATARFDSYEVADAFARGLRVRLLPPPDTACTGTIRRLRSPISPVRQN